MKRIVIVAFIAGIFTACSKDKFESVPQIEIKEFGPEEAIKGNLIELRAVVKDKEGDIQDSLYVVRNRFNATSGAWLNSDTIRYYIATLGAPENQETEVMVRFLYGELRPDIAPIENLVTVDRRYSLGLIVVDKKGNKSEYVESEKILLRKL